MNLEKEKVLCMIKVMLISQEHRITHSHLDKKSPENS